MANHVDNFITVIGNPAATAEFESIFSSVFSDDKGLRDADFLPRDEDGQVDINSIGAKWAYVEDVSEEYASVTSAWSAVLPFVELLGDHNRFFRLGGKNFVRTIADVKKRLQSHHGVVRFTDHWDRKSVAIAVQKVNF